GECGGPLVMNDVFFHIAGESDSSPAFFHAIYALQRTAVMSVPMSGGGLGPTGSVTGCAARHEARHSPRLRLAPPCSQPRPRPGVAELGVVRRLRTPLGA